jgi:hypothetical protein
MANYPFKSRKYLVIPVILLSFLLLPAFSYNDQNRVSAAEKCQAFPETGFKVCGRFLDYWLSHGGVRQQGFPISEEFDEQNALPPAGDGKVHKVQYFQRARFEYHPGQGQFEVLLGLLGAEQFAAKYATPPAAIFAGAGECFFFPETGFKVCGRFLEYWRTNGGLAQQGFPISEVFSELNAPPPQGDGQTHLVQYFQRARFEQHLENPAPHDVLLGLLGTSQYQAKYGVKAQPLPSPVAPIAPLPPPPRVGPPPTPGV